MQEKVSFVTTTLAAKELKVTPQTVRRLIERGELTAYRLENGYNGRHIIERAELAHTQAMRELQTAGKAR